MSGEQKRILTFELAASVKATLKEHGVEQHSISGEVINSVCNATEAVFIHGLKEEYFLKHSRYMKYPEPCFWPFVNKLMHRNVKTQIANLSQIKTDVGRCRAWVRLTLNDAAMENYIESICRDNNLLRHYYHKYAYLRDSEQIEVMKDYMKALSRVPFTSPVNSSMLNTWTPTPLRLAGLTDTISMLGHSASNFYRNSSNVVPEMDDLDVPMGVSALEYEGLVEGPPNSEGQVVVLSASESTNHATMRNGGAGSIVSTVTPSYSTSDVDEVESNISSEFSHRSLIDAKFNDILSRCDRFNITPSDFLDSGIADTVGSPNGVSNNSGPRSSPPGASNPEVRVRHGGRTSRGLNNQRRRSGDRLVPGNTTTRPRTPSLERILQRKSSSDAAVQATENTTNGCDMSVSPLITKTSASANESVTVTVCSPTETVSGESGQLAAKELTPVCNEMSEAGRPAALSSTSSGLVDASPVDHASLNDLSANASVFHGEESLLEPCVNTEQDSALSSNNDDQNTDLIPQFTPVKDNQSSDDSENVTGRKDSETDVESMDAKRRAANSSGDELAMTGSPDTSVSSFTPFSDDLVNYALSPGNSLLRRHGWSSGFVSNLPHDGEQVSFNTILQRTMNSALRSPSPICTNAVESTSGLDFAFAANQPLEVGRAPGDDCHEEMSPTDRDFDLLQAIDKTNESKKVRLSYVTKIAQEVGLDNQKFHCFSCNAQIGLVFSEFRVCAFDGHYYCKDCHTNLDEFIIPSRVIFSWDLQPRKVSRASKAFLEHVSDEPLIDIEKLNSSLYQFVPQLQEILALRQQLSFIAMYLLTCKESVAEDLRKRLWPKEYWFENLHLYSLNDLINVASGQFHRTLRSILAFTIGHVRECRLCCQKGFICEICNDPKVIYPFEVESTYRCESCYSCFHEACKKGKPCPKCLRKEQYHKVKLAEQSSAGNNSKVRRTASENWTDDELILHN